MLCFFARFAMCGKQAPSGSCLRCTESANLLQPRYWSCINMITGVMRKDCSLPSHASVQEAMRAAEATSTEECPVKIKLVAPPLYVLTTNVRSWVHAAMCPQIGI